MSIQLIGLDLHAQQKNMKPPNLHRIPALQKIDVRNTLLLRPLESSDATALLNILEKDSSIRKKVTIASRVHSPRDIETEIEMYQKDEGLIRYTLLKNNVPIGLISFWRDEGYFEKPTSPNDYGFGYFLDPNERGKGLITEAVHCLMDVSKENLHANQFVAFCEDGNHQSIAVLTRLGLKPTNKTFTEPTTGWMEQKYVKSLSNSDTI